MIRLTRPPCPDLRGLRTDYKHPANKQALIDACFEKCMYCESKVTHTYWGDVEHIHPKSRFPDLEFVWDNLGFVCARCNNAKLDSWSDMTRLIDPFIEDPDEYLAAVGPFIFQRNGSERGEYTWRTIDLNRTELFERRRERLDQLRDLIDKMVRTTEPALRELIENELQAELADNKEYAMVSRAVVKQLIGSSPTTA